LVVVDHPKLFSAYFGNLTRDTYLPDSRYS